MVPCGVSPGWITRADIPSAHAEALTRNALDLRFVMDEVALAELVLDELVGGAGVRHPQQRFRQHHQRQPFLGRQRELAQHVLDAAERIVIGPDRLDQPGRRAIDALFLRRIQPYGPEQADGHGTIVGRVGRAEGRRGLADGPACDSLGSCASLLPVEP